MQIGIDIRVELQIPPSATSIVTTPSGETGKLGAGRNAAAVCAGTGDERPGTGLGATDGGKKEICPPRSGQAGEMAQGEPVPLQAPESDGKSHRLNPAQMGRTEYVHTSWPDGN